MSVKRRDKKNRVLHDGESQREDGRYCYKYVGLDGKAKFVYSWKLTDNDTIPSGKRDCESLRSKERKIQALLQEGIYSDKQKITVYQLTERYYLQKNNIKETTRSGYKTALARLKDDPFGLRKIGDVKVSEAKKWLLDIHKQGLSYSTVCHLKSVLKLSFGMAVEDDILVKNPFDFALNSVMINDSAKRDAISKNDEKRFLSFIKNDDYWSKYYEGFYILFKTGLRISEFCGLTLSDIDFENKTLTVSKQLMYTRSKMYISTPKTESGFRILPINDTVCECFRNIIEKRKRVENEFEIEGVSGFLYINKLGRPIVSYQWEKYFSRACEAFNKIYKEPIPKITPHVCRHTYCSNMAKTNIRPKTLQYLMGHSSIDITLNTYTHTKFEDAKAELSALEEDKNYH